MFRWRGFLSTRRREKIAIKKGEKESEGKTDVCDYVFWVWWNPPEIGNENEISVSGNNVWKRIRKCEGGKTNKKKNIIK